MRGFPQSRKNLARDARIEAPCVPCAETEDKMARTRAPTLTPEQQTRRRIVGNLRRFRGVVRKVVLIQKLTGFGKPGSGTPREVAASKLELRAKSSDVEMRKLLDTNTEDAIKAFVDVKEELHEAKAQFASEKRALQQLVKTRLRHFKHDMKQSKVYTDKVKENAHRAHALLCAALRWSQEADDWQMRASLVEKIEEGM